MSLFFFFGGSGPQVPPQPAPPEPEAPAPDNSGRTSTTGANGRTRATPLDGGPMDFYIKVGDTREPIERILRGSDGDPVDLTDATVRFLMRPRADPDGDNVVDAEATIVDEISGHVRYAWQDGDTEEPGHYRGEFEVTYDDDSVETFPNDGYLNVYITTDLG